MPTNINSNAGLSEILWTLFNKPMDVSVEDHYRQMETICNYINLLPGTHPVPITKIERKNLFFNSLPIPWKETFKEMHNLEKSTMSEIRNWMINKKGKVDKEEQKQKKQKEKNKRTSIGSNSNQYKA